MNKWEYRKCTSKHERNILLFKRRRIGAYGIYHTIFTELCCTYKEKFCSCDDGILYDIPCGVNLSRGIYGIALFSTKDELIVELVNRNGFPTLQLSSFPTHEDDYIQLRESNYSKY